MTQKQEIIKFMKDAPDMTVSLGDLYAAFDFPEPSIRRVMGIGTKQETFERLELGIYQLVIQYVRKYVSGLFYCGGHKESWYAVTFEDNDKDREAELVDELEKELQDTCSPMRDNYGYEESDVDIDEVDEDAIYPDIEVGEVQ